MAQLGSYRKEIQVEAKISEYKAVKEFVEPILQKEKLNAIMKGEQMLLLEEIFIKAVDQINDEKALITIAVRKRVNDLIFDISYDGPRFVYDNYVAEDYYIGARIIERYKEKIGVKFRRGHNEIRIQAARSFDTALLYSVFAIVTGFIMGMCIYFFTSKETIDLVIKIVAEIQNIFNTMLLMISAPVTFFSIVTNITSTAVLADRRLNIKGLLKNIAFSSVWALLLGVAYMFSLHSLTNLGVRSRLIVSNESVNMIKEVNQVIPTDIFSAFTSASPFPLIVLAILTAAAISSMNSHFDEAKALNDNINRIFASALKVIYLFLPFLIFVSVIEVILWRGAIATIIFVVYLMVCIVGMLVMFAFNMLRLRRNSYNAREFIKKCTPALLENFKINSPIEAIPYNIRFCNKYLGIKNRYAESAVPIVSQLNLDGNCFLLIFLCSAVYAMTGYAVTWQIIVGLAIVILGLSLGAPNRPGSLLIGLTIALSFIGDASGTVSVVILTEAFIGRALTLINTFGNLVTVQIEAGKAGELKDCQ